ncbi:MFS transporter [Humibacter ginsenosidimutans]|uniref:MFS transporter n=2 Tax=Humibacter ginsenosidimutans TaxID=2599293 RepID=A0A5B8M8F5_9MICO|nr:MFS transporter [Humibacter ginsenosidimutans]
MAQTFAAFVVYFYVEHLGVPAAWVAGAMVAHGILSAVLNPALGAVSDRARTRWGRRVPWIVIGTGPLVVAFALIWMPPSLPPVGALVWFLAVVAVYDAAGVAVVLNISALFPEIFRTTGERAKGNTPRQIFGLIGMILGTAGAPLLYGTIGWAGMGIGLGVVCLGLYLWSFTGMIERVPSEVAATAPALGWRDQLRYTLANRAFLTYVIGSLLVQSSTSIVLATVPFYVKYGLGQQDVADTAVLAAIFAAALPALAGWSWVVRRTSPRTALLWSMAAYTVASLAYLLPSSLPGAVAVGLALGIGVAGILQLLEVALSQIIDDDERRTGLRREGTYYGVNGFVVKGSVIVQAIVVAAVLTASGYDASLHTEPSSVVTGVRLLMAVFPAIGAALAFVSFWFYPLRERDVPVPRANDDSLGDETSEEEPSAV